MKNNNTLKFLTYCSIGLFILFTTNNSLAQPANDCCTGAIPLTVDATNTCVPILGDNTTATDCMEATPTCASYAGGDTWYEVTVPASGQLTIDLDAGDGTVTDMGMSWYSGPCGALVELECNDDDGPGLFPSISQNGLNPGDIIYVQVWEFGNNAFGDFNICAYEPPPPPPGDECSNPIPYPGDVAAGTCVTGFDFTVFGDSGNPSPSCDFGGDAVAFFSWTAPIITAAGDPLDLIFDDGDGQANDCDIGIEVYEGDCTSGPVSNCLGNVSGTLTGLVQGMDYVLLIYDDSVPDATCDFCLTVACSSPIATATAICQPGDDSGFYVELDVTNFGVGNTAYTVDIAGSQANVTVVGVTTYGPFPNGTPVDVVLAGVDDATCGITIIGLNKSCNIVDGIAQGDTFCSTDATVAATPVIPPDPGVTAVLTVEGAFDGEIGLGLYDGTWDDGSAIGLPPAGMGLFGTDAETQLEAATPNAGAGSTDPNVAIAGSWGDPAPLGASFTSGPLVDGNTYTLFIIDDFGDGWNDNDAELVDCEGNVILGNLNQYIEPISGDDQDEVAWVTFTYTAPLPTITWSGAGAVTDDPDGMPSSGDEVYTFDPSMAGAAGCDPTDVDLTMSVLFCGVTCDEVVTVTVNPPAQAPTITLDDDVCNYTIVPACAGDVLDVATVTAAPGEDPLAIDVTATTAGGCVAIFPVDPPICPLVAPPCQGIDIAAGLPVIPTEVCAGATADICLTLIDAAEGLEVTGTIDGVAVVLVGVAGAGPNELCVTINAPANETCAPVDVVILIDAITCTDGTDYPGILGGATLLDDLTGAGLNPINVPVYPTLSVVTTGDAACGDLTATLEATDGTICATAAGSPFTCAVDGETLAYDFTADVVAFTAVPLDCPLPTLTGTLTCDGCACLSAPSAISTTDPTRICIDGVADPINVAIDTDGGGVGTWVITDAAGIILALPPAPPFDLDGAGAGQCLIWYVNADDATFMPMVGDDAAAAVTAFGCAFLSNPITVDRIEVTSATISSPQSPITICVDDGMDEPVDVTIDDAGIGAMGAWVITDAAGIILALPAGPPFVLDGAGVGTCLIWWVNYEDPAFAPVVGDDAPAIVAAATCAALSNSVEVVREICDPCGASPSTISTADPTRICIDGIADPINVTIDVDGGATGTWVITDAAGIILALPAGPPFDLDGAGAGQCLIWYVNSNDAAFTPMVGDDAAAAVAASSCAFLSNPITVDRIEVTAATISSPQSPITICTDDDMDEPIDVTIDDAGIGANGAWVITDAAGTILALPPGPPFVLDGAGVGTCLIWWVNYDDPAFAPAVGDNAPAIIAAATCAALSNSVEVVREENCGTCEEEISYVVALDNCDFTGATIELFDDATGMSLGTMAIGASGGIGTFGIQPCGDYSFVINGAPACYIAAGGDVGPRAFSTDGTNDTTINFNPLQIPTLSQWGLMVLALLLMSFGAIKIGVPSIAALKRT